MSKVLFFGPGELANRPRYVIEVDVFVLVCVCMIVRLTVYDALTEDLYWSGVSIPTLTLRNVMDLLNFCSFFGLCFKFTWMMRDDDLDYLRTKMHAVFDEFIKKTKLTYKGIHAIKLNNPGCVLHPVDNFIKHYYDKYYPRRCVEAFSTYKRVNPTLKLKLNHLEQYAEPFHPTVPVDELKFSLDELMSSVEDESLNDLYLSIKKSVETRAFDEIKIDPTSAAGYPYPQGKKKREYMSHAVDQSLAMIDGDEEFDMYMRDHVWYTTGRAKMVSVDKEDSARLICYSGYAVSLISMLVIQPWSNFMNSEFEWCGVGFSWMNCGANKFANYFESRDGVAPVGFRYVSVDISQWDTRLHHDLISLLVYFYDTLLCAAEVVISFRLKFRRIVLDMINAVILMPGGHSFKTSQGMKSGWGGTANDNTLLHELVFRSMCRRFGVFIKHVLYGDDNFMLVPDRISDDMIVEEYLRFGLVVKNIHSSRFMSEVDFLSKHVIYCNGNYYPFRNEVETHARLLMPEESDPRRRDKPDPVVAAERALGHLLDNPFNKDVREVCLDLLTKLRDEYSIEYIEVHDELRKQHPWRMFDLTKIPRKFCIVPDFAFIEELYGVPIPSNLDIVWPNKPTHIINGFFSSADSLSYDIACRYSNDVALNLYDIAGRKSKSVVRKVSPYKQPTKCYGFHAARLEFAVKFFGLSFRNALDFGSHPGACAVSLLKYCQDVVCVSLKPKKDRNFCPYVFKNSGVRIIEYDANLYKPDRVYDLCHDDVDIVGDRTFSDDIEVGRGMLQRSIKFSKSCHHYLMTMKEVDWSIKEMMYEAYLVYGYVDFVKPFWSNPWKSEFMVLFKHFKGPRMRKTVFLNKVNGFLNSMAPQILIWSEILAKAISNYKGLSEVPDNKDKYGTELEEVWIKDF